MTAAGVTPDLWITLAKSAAMLSIVLGALIGVLLLMRRLFYGSAASGGQGVIRTLASCYVAPKERLLLIEVLGEKLLVGVTPHSINCLGKITGDSGMALPVQEAPGGLFTHLLKGALRRRPMTD